MQEDNIVGKRRRRQGGWHWEGPEAEEDESGEAEKGCEVIYIKDEEEREVRREGTMRKKVRKSAVGYSSEDEAKGSEVGGKDKVECCEVV